MKPLASCLQLPLYLIYIILELSCITSSGTFSVVGPQVQPTLALVGEDVQLPCHLSTKMDARGMTVKWVRGPLVVHLYRLGQEVEEVQAPLFQGRTKMLRQDMAEGKVTVSIHQVQLSDTGRYTCYFQAGAFYNETSFDLQVAAGPFTVIGPAQLLQAKQGEDIMLSCHLSPKMDARKMIVKWFRNKTLVHRYHHEDKLEEIQDLEFQGRSELLKHDLAEGKVILRIHQVQVSDAGPYSCHFQSPDYYNDAHFELQVAGLEFGNLFSENLLTSWKMLAMMVAIVVFTGSFMVIYCFCQTKLPENQRDYSRASSSRRRTQQGPTRLSWEIPASP